MRRPRIPAARGRQQGRGGVRAPRVWL